MHKLSDALQVYLLHVDLEGQMALVASFKSEQVNLHVQHANVNFHPGFFMNVDAKLAVQFP